jgi:hypothetical protein
MLRWGLVGVAHPQIYDVEAVASRAHSEIVDAPEHVLGQLREFFSLYVLDFRHCTAR